MQKKRENEDCVFVRETTEAVVCLISDGATESKHGKKGAEIACKAANDLLLNADFSEFDERKTAFLIWEEVFFQLKKEADSNNEKVSDYACTLMFACLYKKENKLITYNIGNGLILVETDEKYICCSSSGQQSEAEILVPNKNAYEYAAINRFISCDVDSVFLCSDGAKDVMFSNNMSVKQLIDSAAKTEAEDDFSFIEIRLR